MPRSSCVATVASVILALGAVASAKKVSPFGAVKEGVFGIYTIDDITTPILDDDPLIVVDDSATKAKLAAEVGSLIRQVIGVGLWTADGGTGAAMVLTPNQITIKASPDIQQQVAGLLAKLREQRELFIHCDYRIVESTEVSQALAKAKPGSTSVILDDQTVQTIEKAKKCLLATSSQTVPNGVNRLWIDNTDGVLPTVCVRPVMSADRKFVTANISMTGGEPGHDLNNMSISVPSGGTAAIPLNDQLTRWLVFKVEALRSELKRA